MNESSFILELQIIYEKFSLRMLFNSHNFKINLETARSYCMPIIIHLLCIFEM